MNVTIKKTQDNVSRETLIPQDVDSESRETYNTEKESEKGTFCETF